MKRIMITTGLAAFAIAGAAAAGDWQAKFDGMDTNSDGVVSEAEFTTYKTTGGDTTEADAREKFLVLAGPDGELTLAEFEAAIQVRSDMSGTDGDDTTGAEDKTDMDEGY
jgi:hypothetical protein